MIPLGVLASSRPAATVSGGFLTSASSINNDTAYSFSALDLGAEAATRRIHVVVAVRKAEPSASVTDVTIAGVAASLDLEVIDQGSTMAIWSAAIPSGISGTVAVSTSLTVLRCHVHIYRTVGASATPVGTSAPESTQTGIFNVASASGGFVIAASSHTSSSTVVSWSGVSQDSEVLAEYVSTVASAPSIGSLTEFSVAWSRISGPAYAHAAVAYAPA